MTHESDIPLARAWIEQGGGESFTVDGTVYDGSCGIAMLGFCGCGCPEMAAQYLLDVLRQFEDGGPQGFDGSILNDLPEPVFWLLLYWMDDRGWLEHGGGVRGSWLTDDGKLAIQVLDAQLKLEPNS